MLHRSRPSGAQNRKRKMQGQKSNEAQLGSLKLFVGIEKKNNDNVEENIEHNKNPQDRPWFDDDMKGNLPEVGSVYPYYTISSGNRKDEKVLPAV